MQSAAQMLVYWYVLGSICMTVFSGFRQWEQWLLLPLVLAYGIGTARASQKSYPRRRRRRR